MRQRPILPPSTPKRKNIFGNGDDVGALDCLPSSCANFSAPQIPHTPLERAPLPELPNPSSAPIRGWGLLGRRLTGSLSKCAALDWTCPIVLESGCRKTKKRHKDLNTKKFTLNDGLILPRVLGKSSLPEIDGEFQATELEQPEQAQTRSVEVAVAPGEVVRDEFGVPHMSAATEHDLYFLNGVVHAQESCMQMPHTVGCVRSTYSNAGSQGLVNSFDVDILGMELHLRTACGRCILGGCLQQDASVRLQGPFPWTSTGEQHIALTVKLQDFLMQIDHFGSVSFLVSESSSAARGS
eukprot:1177715-Amphidinium_carterae.1